MSVCTKFSCIDRHEWIIDVLHGHNVVIVGIKHEWVKYLKGLIIKFVMIKLGKLNADNDWDTVICSMQWTIMQNNHHMIVH